MVLSCCILSLIWGDFYISYMPRFFSYVFLMTSKSCCKAKRWGFCLSFFAKLVLTSVCPNTEGREIILQQRFFVDLNLYMILYGWAHVAASMQFKRRECMFGRHLTALLSLFFVSAVHVAVLLACANTVANLWIYLSMTNPQFVCMY